MSLICCARQRRRIEIFEDVAADVGAALFRLLDIPKNIFFRDLRLAASARAALGRVLRPPMRPVY